SVDPPQASSGSASPRPAPPPFRRNDPGGPRRAVPLEAHRGRPHSLADWYLDARGLRLFPILRTVRGGPRRPATSALRFEGGGRDRDRAGSGGSGPAGRLLALGVHNRDRTESPLLARRRGALLLSPRPALDRGSRREGLARPAPHAWPDDRLGDPRRRTLFCGRRRLRDRALPLAVPEDPLAATVRDLPWTPGCDADRLERRERMIHGAVADAAPLIAAHRAQASRSAAAFHPVSARREASIVVPAARSASTQRIAPSPRCSKRNSTKPSASA